MNYKISEDRKTLTILADAEDRERIKLVIETGENEQGVTCDIANIIEPIVCNSELEWINPADTGDLTDAPMLGTFGDEMTIEEIEQSAKTQPGIYGSVLCGHNHGKDVHLPILERWAYMSYQVRSVLEDLRDNGNAVFIS